jgi:hypothetical protein
MQLVLAMPGAPVLAFMAIDSRVLVASIDEAFGQIFSDAHISGWEYLDKIVQLPFSLPAPAPIKINRLVESCMDASATKPQLVADKIRSFLKELAAQILDDRSHFASVYVRVRVEGQYEYIDAKLLLLELDAEAQIDDMLLVRKAARLLTTTTKNAESLCDTLGEEGMEITCRAVTQGLQAAEVEISQKIDWQKWELEISQDVLRTSKCLADWKQQAQKMKETSKCQLEQEIDKLSEANKEMKTTRDRFVHRGFAVKMINERRVTRRIAKLRSKIHTSLIPSIDLIVLNAQAEMALDAKDRHQLGTTEMALNSVHKQQTDVYEAAEEDLAIVIVETKEETKEGEQEETKEKTAEPAAEEMERGKTRITEAQAQLKIFTKENGEMRQQTAAATQDCNNAGVGDIFKRTVQDEHVANKNSVEHLFPVAHSQLGIACDDSTHTVLSKVREAETSAAQKAEENASEEDLDLAREVGQHRFLLPKLGQARRASLWETAVLQEFMSILDPTPRRLKRIVNIYQLMRAVAHKTPVDEATPHGKKVSDMAGFTAFLGKLIKWACLCEWYPYRMSIFILKLLDQQRMAASNELARRHPQNTGKNTGFFVFQRPCSALCDEDRSKLSPREHFELEMPISTAFYKFAEPHVYGNELSSKLLQLDGDNEQLTVLLMLPVLEDPSHPTATLDRDILVRDILPCGVNTAAGEGDATGNSLLTLLPFSFNLNPGMREQLSSEISILVKGFELRRDDYNGRPERALEHGSLQRKVSLQRSLPTPTPKDARAGPRREALAKQRGLPGKQRESVEDDRLPRPKLNKKTR